MEKESIEPLKITLTVVAARKLKCKRKGEVCQSSVVFGMGKELFQTEVMESNEPFWNQEAHIHVGPKGGALTFKFKDQGHTMGIVTVPIATITTRRHEQWYPLQPYKKEKEVNGELCLNCFISEFKPATVPSSCDINDDTSEKKKGLFHSFQIPHLKTSPDTSKSPADSVGDQEEETNIHVDDSAPPPEVTGISPSEGSVDGNERIILRGNNLGESRSDIVRIELVGVDCTSGVEYFSCGKLSILSPPQTSACTGPVTIETVSGGRGVSSLKFTYKSKQVVSPSPSTVNKAPTVKMKDKELTMLQNENQSLKQQLQDLTKANALLSEENNSLKEYTGKLLSAIMSHSPELLEIVRQQ